MKEDTSVMLMGIFILDSFQMVKLMAMVFISGLMGNNMMGNGKKA
jgi:hypothetical protein